MPVRFGIASVAASKNTCSVHKEIANLLTLQEVDGKLAAVQAQLQASPREMERLRTRITGVEADIEKERSELKRMEVRAAELNSERKSVEEKILKYKTQQMTVKKNEEYQALTAEIEGAQARCSALEDEELTVLMELDDARKTNAESEAAHRKSITELEGEVELVRRREEALKGEVAGLEEKVEAARAEVSADFLAGYERAKQRVKRAPWVVPVEDHRCMGCHLKVSGSLESEARGADGPIHCDQCGRLIYLD